ncbi:Nitrogen permease regulator 2, partial [Cladochytrium tenue]
KANDINLKLLPNFAEPDPVQDWDVPVAVVKFESFESLKHWDLTLQRIIPRINGVNYVKQIAELADVDLELARLGVQHLLYYGTVRLVDIFQFGNVYMSTRGLRKLLDSGDLQTECKACIHTGLGNPPTIDTLFRLFQGLHHGVTVRQWMEKNELQIANIDVRRMIVFGVVQGLLVRIHKFPVYCQPTPAQGAPPSAPKEELRKLLP